MPHSLPQVSEIQVILAFTPSIAYPIFFPRLALSNDRGRGKHDDDFAYKEQNEDDKEDMGLHSTHNVLKAPFVSQAENDTVKWSPNQHFPSCLASASPPRPRLIACNRSSTVRISLI
jgi:hypothetical protein